MSNEKMIEEVATLVAELRPMFAHRHPMVQSAALADLTAIYLSGLIALDDDREASEEATLELRAGMFHLFVQTVEALVPMNAAMTKPTHGARRRQ